MRKAAMALVIFLLMCAQLFAGNEYSVRSRGRLNGHFWNSLEEMQKLTLIWGIMDGVVLCADSDFSVADGDEAKANALFGTLFYYLPKATSYQDLIAYIDNFYSDESNLNIPIVSAYSATVLEENGHVSHEEIEGAIYEWRDYYGEQESAPQQ